MRRFAAATLAAVCSAAVLGAPSPTAEDIVAKNIEARGGIDRIRAVQTLRMTGTMLVGEDRLPTTIEWKRPNKVRWEFEADGQTAIQVYDGKKGWTLMPFEGNRDAEEMSDQELEDVALQADLDGPLVDAAAKGNTVSLLGKDDADARPAWELRIKRKNGDERFVYIDAQTYLQTKTVTKRSAGGREIEIQSIIDDYRSVEGLVLPHSFDASAPGMPQGQSLRFTKTEVNVPIDDARFQKPATEPAPKPTPRPERQTTPSHAR